MPGGISTTTVTINDNLPASNMQMKPNFVPILIVQQNGWKIVGEYSLEPHCFLLLIKDISVYDDTLHPTSIFIKNYVM